MTAPNKVRYTWHDVVDALNTDTACNTMLLSSVSASEEPPRSPVALYLSAVADLIGANKDAMAALDALPEPNSNQEKRRNGLNELLSENEAKFRDGDPTRFWDKYKYKLSGTGETVDGSVYSDMAARHVLGSSFKDGIKLIDAWTNNDTDKSSLIKVLRFNGQDLDMATMSADRAKTIRSTLTSRFNKLADNFRVMSAVHRNKRDIEERMSEKVEVEFIYNRDGDPSSGLAELKEPIRLCQLITIPEHPRFGQRGSAARAYTAKAFANLSVDQAFEKGGEKGPDYAVLIDTKKVRIKLPGKGKSSQDKDKALIEGLVSSNNAPSIFSNLRIYTEQDGAKAALIKRLKDMDEEERRLFYYDMVETINFFSQFQTKDVNRIHDEVKEEQELQGMNELAAADAKSADIAEAERQPTQNERLATVPPAEPPKQFITTEDVDKGNAPSKSTSGRRSAGTSGKRSAN